MPENPAIAPINEMRFSARRPSISAKYVDVNDPRISATPIKIDDVYGSMDVPAFWNVVTAYVTIANTAVQDEQAVNARPIPNPFNAARLPAQKRKLKIWFTHCNKVQIQTYKCLQKQIFPWSFVPS